MRQTSLSLTAAERRVLDGVRAKGMHLAREFNRAHILLSLDRGVREAQIMDVLGIGRTMIWRTRAAYAEGGLDLALHDAPRTGKPKQYQTDEEAHVVALACSSPPAGARRWTVALLTQAAREQRRMKRISRETIRRLLKKTSSNLGRS